MKNRYLMFAPDPDATVNKLRGAAVMVSLVTRGGYELLGPEIAVDLDGNWFGPPTVTLASLNTNETFLKIVEAQARSAECAVGIDVHFPFTDMDYAFSLNPDVTDEAVREHWSDPHNREIACRMLEAADFVTVPKTSWHPGDTFYDDLRVFNRRIVVLPDLEGSTPRDYARRYKRFARRLTWNWAKAAWRKRHL